MKEDYTDITVILDRSQSMARICRETESGFNEFVGSQRTLPGTATLSLVQFDDEYSCDYVARDIRQVPPLYLVPRGTTALYDAIGRTINTTGNRLSRMAEKDRPGKVVMVILTDGEENASKHFSREAVFEMIEHQKSKYNWEFIFLGANQDALKVGSSFGISKEYSMTFAANTGGVVGVYDTLASNMTMLRSSEYVVGSGFFNAKDRAAQAAAGVKETA